MSYRLQSVLFSKPEWTVETASQWILSHRLKLKKVDDKAHHLRFRQLNPSYLRRLGYTHFITKKIGNGIELLLAYPHEESGGNIFHKAYDIGKKVLFGNKELPRRVQDLLSQYGKIPLVSGEIERTPLPSVLQGIANLAGAYDTLFHLGIVFRLQDGKRILFEKNQVINAEINPRTNSHTERIPVQFGVKGKTLDEVIDKTRQRMGDKFLPYSALHNNCQDFIVAILKANGMDDGYNSQWVKQDVKYLSKDRPYLRKAVNTLTDIAARADAFIHG